MATLQPFVGYSGLIWNNVYRTLDYFFTQLQTAQSTNNAAGAISISQTVLATLNNAVDAIDAYDYATAWQITGQQMFSIAQLPLSGIDPTTAAFFTARMNSYINGAPALLALVPLGPFPTPSGALPNGTPVIPDVGLLEFYEKFSLEVVPAGLTGTNFNAEAQACATAFYNIAAAIKVFQGQYPTQLYDICVQQANIAQEVVNGIDDFVATVNNDILDTNAWNQIVALPAISTSGALSASAPFTLAAQQSAVIRYAMLTYSKQIEAFLTAMNTPTIAQVATAIVRNNDTLMDIANRELGNFERWTEIATLNNLQPPWIGPTTTATVAGYGTRILLPSPGTSLPATGNNISYPQNLMGTDLFFGPVNGNMPSWGGDFQTIAGFNNLRVSLGRRLQTSLGSLMYHPDFGSRVPSEIGQIQSNETATQILAFGQSAIITDPRVQTIAQATISRDVDGTINFSAQVQPIGNRNSAITVTQALTGAGL